MKRTLLMCLISPILATGCASLVTPDVDTSTSALKPGIFELDETHAALTFKIDHLGFSNYVGRFEVFSANLDLDEQDPEAARVDAVIDMTSLDIANDEFADTLMSDWFKADSFPKARFTSTEVLVTGDNRGQVEGELTLRGVTQPVTLDVTFNGGARDLIRGNAYIVGFSASGTIDRTDFGINNLSGVITNKVEINIEAEFVRQSGG